MALRAPALAVQAADPQPTSQASDLTRKPRPRTVVRAPLATATVALGAGVPAVAFACTVGFRVIWTNPGSSLLILAGAVDDAFPFLIVYRHLLSRMGIRIGSKLAPSSE